MRPHVACLAVLLLYATGCGNADSAINPAEVVAPSKENQTVLKALAPGTIEELSSRPRTPLPTLHQPSPSGVTPENYSSQGTNRAKQPALSELSSDHFAAVLQSKVIQRSPELARILTATRLDPTGKMFANVMHSLPLEKSQTFAAGEKGVQTVTTYHYKGHPLIRFHGQVIGKISDAGALPMKEQPASYDAFTLRPVSNTSLAATSISRAATIQEEDPYASVEELETSIAELEAVEWEVEEGSAYEDAEFADWEDWYSTVVDYRHDALAPSWSMVANVGCPTGASARFVTSALVESCFDKHYAKAVGVITGLGTIRTFSTNARNAYASAIASYGIQTLVRVSVTVFWGAAAVAAAGTIAYGIYIAYDCYHNRQASWSPARPKDHARKSIAATHNETALSYG